MNNKENLRYVAHFDMLGFKSAVCRNIDEAWGALSDLRAALDQMHSYGIKDTYAEKDIRNKIHAKILSDTIICYSLDNTSEDLMSILMLSAQLYYDSLSKCVPLRGGISYGKFYINENLDLVCGIPLIKAYQISENLQWSGIVVDESVANIFFNTRNGSSFFQNDLLVEWGIPSKEKKNNKCWVVNWPKIHFNDFKNKMPITVDKYYAPLERLFGEYNNLSDYVKNKYVNTVDFINNVIKNKNS